MGEDEELERDRCPEPADLDEVDVEDVLLLREVRGRELRGVGLQKSVVWRVAGLW